MSGAAIDLAGKTVIITGASSGIGRATVQLFAKAGAHIVINHWQDLEGAERTRALCAKVNAGASTAIIEADMGAPEGPAKLFAAALHNFGQVDIVINNAGIKRAQDPIGYDIADFEKVLSVNLLGAFRLAQIALKHFLGEKKPGTILCVSSVHDQTTLVSDIGYSMSKAALLMMVKSLAKASEGGTIRVNAVSPGAIETPMNPQWVKDKRLVRKFAANVPLRRAGLADDIAGALLFLASDYAAYITGQTIYVDGGMTL